MKYYFENEESEMCYNKQYFKEKGITEAWAGKKIQYCDQMFCRYNYEVGEKGECGKKCETYEPRNGKSGICKHYGYLYVPFKKVKI
jgi:hypothetical protein